MRLFHLGSGLLLVAYGLVSCFFALTRALRARCARPPEVAEKAYSAAYLAALQPRAQRA